MPSGTKSRYVFSLVNERQLANAGCPKAAIPVSTRNRRLAPAPSHERTAAYIDRCLKADGQLSTKNGLSASKFRALAPPLYCARVSRA